MRFLGLNLRRRMRLLAVLVRYVVARSVHRLGWHSGTSDPGPERLHDLFQDLGGTFLKFGQMLALQPHLLPVAYCDALLKLLDRLPACPIEEVERVLLEELGRSSAELFDHFEPRPMAAASVGQVHVAWAGGRKLAVKVQRATAQADFLSDLALMALAMGLIRGLRIKPLFWLLEPMAEFIEWTREELDYRREAWYMQTLRHQATSPHQYIPEVLPAYTTRRTLVMELLDGVTVLDYLRARDQGDELTLHRVGQRHAPAADGFDPERFAAHLIDNFLEQVFVHGLFHADLHPANLVILPGNVVGYLDFGITGGLSPFFRRHLMAMVLAWARGDLAAMSRAIFKITAREPGAKERQAFRRGLAAFGDSWYELEGVRPKLRKSFTVMMIDLLGLCQATQVWTEREVIKYIRSSVAMDGLLTRLVPGFDLGHYLEAAWRARCGIAARPEGGVGGERRVPAWMSRVLKGPAAGSWQLLHSGLMARDLLQRLTLGELSIAAELDEAAQEQTQDRHAPVLVAVLVLLLALPLVLDGRESGWGFNLFTAQAFLVTAGSWGLLRRFRSRGRRLSPRESS